MAPWCCVTGRRHLTGPRGLQSWEPVDRLLSIFCATWIWWDKPSSHVVVASLGSALSARRNLPESPARGAGECKASPPKVSAPRSLANQSRPTPAEMLVNVSRSCPQAISPMYSFQSESHAPGPLPAAKGLASVSNHCHLHVCGSAGCALPRGGPSLASSAGTSKSPC